MLLHFFFIPLRYCWHWWFLLHPVAALSRPHCSCSFHNWYSSQRLTLSEINRLYTSRYGLTKIWCPLWCHVTLTGYLRVRLFVPVLAYILSKNIWIYIEFLITMMKSGYFRFKHVWHGLDYYYHEVWGYLLLGHLER